MQSGDPWNCRKHSLEAGRLVLPHSGFRHQSGLESSGVWIWQVCANDKMQRTEEGEEKEQM